MEICKRKWKLMSWKFTNYIYAFHYVCVGCTTRSDLKTAQNC